MAKDVPTPPPRAIDGTTYSCPYRGEVESIRAWRLWGPVVLGIVGTVLVAVGLYACDNAGETGTLTQQVTNNAEKINEVRSDIREYRRDIRNIENERSKRDVYLSGQLGEISQELKSINSRMKTLEDSTVRRRPRGR